LKIVPCYPERVIEDIHGILERNLMVANIISILRRVPDVSHCATPNITLFVEKVKAVWYRFGQVVSDTVWLTLGANRGFFIVRGEKR
jgi:hypothetical protein